MAGVVDNKKEVGDKWILGRNFNDIRNPEEKSSMRPRSEASYKRFREFIERTNIEEMEFQEMN